MCRRGRILTFCVEALVASDKEEGFQCVTSHEGGMSRSQKTLMKMTGVNKKGSRGVRKGVQGCKRKMLMGYQ